MRFKACMIHFIPPTMCAPAPLHIKECTLKLWLHQDLAESVHTAWMEASTHLFLTAHPMWLLLFHIIHRQKALTWKSIKHYYITAHGRFCHLNHKMLGKMYLMYHQDTYVHQTPVVVCMHHPHKAALCAWYLSTVCTTSHPIVQRLAASSMDCALGIKMRTIMSIQTWLMRNQ